jgi:hypothetical protein
MIDHEALHSCRVQGKLTPSLAGEILQAPNKYSPPVVLVAIQLELVAGLV